MASFEAFYKSMSQHYKRQRDALEDQNAQLWGIALGLVKAIGESEHDGSGIRDLKDLGEGYARDMKAMLEQQR